MIGLGFQVAATIATGDVSAARNLGSRKWTTGERAAISAACAKWGVAPESFGVAPKSYPGPFGKHPVLDALRAHLGL